jgi:hypothetical protein
MSKDENPECPEGHGEMVRKMQNVTIGEKLDIADWECETCGKVITVPLSLS